MEWFDYLKQQAGIGRGHRYRVSERACRARPAGLVRVRRTWPLTWSGFT